MLKKIIIKLEDVEEGLRTLYELNADGKYHLKLEDDDAKELRTALQKERDLRKELTKDIEKYKDIDPDKARKALADLEQLEADKLAAKGNFDTLKQQLVEKHTAAETGWNTEKRALTGTIEKLVVDNTAIQAITDAKGKVRVLLPHVKQHVRVKLDGDEPVAVVVNAKGEERIRDDKGTRMTIADLVEELKKDPDYAPNFESDSKGGSGAAAGGPPRGGGAERTVKRSDQAAINRNMAAIAKGEVTIVD